MDVKPEAPREARVGFFMTKQEALDISEVLSSFTADELLEQLNSTNKRHFTTEEDPDFKRINQSTYSFMMAVLEAGLRR